MAKLFQAEKQKMADLDKAEILQKSKKQSLLPTEWDEDEDEADSQTGSLYRLNTRARKQSLLPRGNLFIILLHIRSNMTNTMCILYIRV